MNIAFRDLCIEYSIPTAPDDHKHARDGWIQVECPFCIGNAGYHLGWCVQDEYFHCWRCGWHSMDEVVAELTAVKGFDLKQLLSEYRTTSKARSRSSKASTKGGADRLKLPLCGELCKPHIRYLESRGFDPVKLESLWGLMGTKGIGRYKNRIIAPVHLNGTMVSYQGRDVTGKQELRYKACAIEKEVVHHKHTLYGIDHCKDSIVVVEGISDVWRLGYGAACTFGIKFTTSQLRMIASKKRRYVLFDTQDPQAREQGKKLADMLALLPGLTEYIELGSTHAWINPKAGKDPGNLTQREANAIMAELT